ncbi:MAG TPA: hypothetical protein VKA89_09865 [Solirubrobacterales bacterium]|nr:hypothetical protein [Solirubrobacterales bacterium]
MSGLDAAVAAVALLAGLTGTWSPCGFSVIETLGPTGHRGGRALAIVSCLAFALGAPLGGVVTFGGLAAIGDLAGTGGRLAFLLAAGLAVAAGLADARRAPIRPQIRRQLPEPWRRRLPMPLTGFLYGVLLGLGFTTFVLSFGLFALAGVCLSVGDPSLGAIAGLAFGAGRALPVLVIGPFVDLSAGIRMAAAMAERPGIYYGFRLGDAGALGAVAIALVITPHVAGADESPALARAEPVRAAAADPSAYGGTLVVQGRRQRGLIRRRGGFELLPGTDPAVGGPYVAVLRRDNIVLLLRPSLREVASYRAPGVREVAVSGSWLVWLTGRGRGRQAIRTRRILHRAHPGRVRTVARARPPVLLGRPSLSNGRVAFTRASPRSNAIRVARLRSGRVKTLLVSHTIALGSPTLAGRALLYVRSAGRRQQLRVRRLGRRGSRTLFARRRRFGTFWTTAIDSRRAYLTVLRFGERGRAKSRVLRVGRR